MGGTTAAENTGYVEVPLIHERAEPPGVADRFAIFEQLHAQQRVVDGDASRAFAPACVDLCWPEAIFPVHGSPPHDLEGESG